MRADRKPWERPIWQKRAFRLWRRWVLVGLLRKEGLRYIVPPREWDTEMAEAAIARGQELAKEHGW